SISSWESRNVPPAQRLRAYARFFATRRSVESGRLLDDDELTEDERARRSDLEQELLALRAGALDTGYAPAVDTDGITPGLWRFEDGKPITIVVAEMPAELRARFAPYTDPDDPQ